MLPARRIPTNGINLFVHESGEGPAVVLMHGFPGLGYSWHNQVPALTAAGFRVVAPDQRGYGHSDAPEAVEEYDITKLTGDMVGILDALDIERAVFVGHDWGGLVAWQLPLFHPGRVAGVVSVSTPFIPHWMTWLHPDLVSGVLPAGSSFVADPSVDPIAQMRQVYTEKMYVLMYQDGHHADDAMNAETRRWLQAAYRKDLPTVDQWADLPPEALNMEYHGSPLPADLADLPGNDVLTAADLDTYEEGYKQHGFTPPINWYRNLTRNWEISRNMDQTIRVPSLMISGANDLVLRARMAEGMDEHVPDLERHVVADSWHCTLEDQPDEVNRVMTSWLQRRFLNRSAAE
jgi:soluble epoxide hydrolase/lipid-phosphate phosphatase